MELINTQSSGAHFAHAWPAPDGVITFVGFTSWVGPSMIRQPASHTSFTLPLFLALVNSEMTGIIGEYDVRTVSFGPPNG